MPEEWYFRKHDPGDTTYNPLGGEHFTEDRPDTGWKSGESLVRECIQNSIDAAHTEQEPVSVRFLVSEPEALGAEKAHFWFGSLWPHLRSKDCSMPYLPQRPGPCGFLVIEDFGTLGLVGDIEQTGLSDDKNRFFNFFRAQGLSGNSEDANTGGSWGEGKSVFNRCSGINSFLALSVRRDDEQAILMGRAVLREHRIEQGGQSTQFKAFGLFGRPHELHENFVLPVTDTNFLMRFGRDFQITRPIGEDAGADAAGLSVVIPYADDDITCDGIVDIVIRQYFHPIIAGHLIVRVTGSHNGNPRTVDIDAEKILDLAREWSDPEVHRLLELSRWSLGADAREHCYQANEPDRDKAPCWDDRLLRLDEPRFAQLVEQFEKGEPIAVRLPLWVYPKDGQPERDSFTVYLQRDLDGDGYRPVFVRNMIVVPNARERAVRGHHLLALVPIGKGPLAGLLRASEPPAHTNWDPKTANFKGKYSYGQQVIDYVRNAPRNLANALSSGDTEPDPDVWADLFPVPDDGKRRSDDGKKKKGKRKTPTEPVPPPQSKPAGQQVEQLAGGGFAIIRANADCTELPPCIRVKLGYSVSRGNAINRYNKADFNLAKLSVASQNCVIVECSGNVLVVEPEDDDFRVAVTGFDLNRDLDVRPRREDRSEGGEA